MADESSDRREIDKLGLDFGEAHPRVEAVNEDGSFVFSRLSAFGQKLADRSAANPHGWKHDSGFNPFNVPRKGATETDAYTQAMERLFAPALLNDFR
jgi:hypothetical protein